VKERTWEARAMVEITKNECDFGKKKYSRTSEQYKNGMVALPCVSKSILRQSLLHLGISN
jgi:hypothetical protein